MLLSIIIPTKNRYSTLFNVVEMLLSFDLNDDMEIIIQDNSDDNKAALDFFAQKTIFKNLHYYFSKEELSVIENSDKAVLNSIGEFVCFIGDDDAVMPNIVDVTKWMKANNYKALKSYEPNYYWPNQKANYLSNDTSGVFRYKKWKPDSFEIISTNDALNFTLNRGAVLIDKLPCLYHGIVNRNTLDVIYKKANTFFPGPSPDMANAIALTQVIDSYVLVKYTVIISGKSTTSAGGAGVLHQHVARIEDVKHLPKSTSKNWDKRIPKYWTGPTIYADSAIKALEVFQNTEALGKFNFDYLYTYIEVFNKKQIGVIFKDFEIKNRFKIQLLKIEIFLMRVFIFISNRNGSIKIISGIKDIKTAVDIATKL